MANSPLLISRRQALGAAAAVVACSALPQTSFGQLRVDIDRGLIEPMPIAISPFGSASPSLAGLGQRITDVVAADLAGSGLFRILDPAGYLQSSADLAAGPKFSDWRQINAEAVLGGSVEPEVSGRVAISFRLWDVLRGEQIAGIRFSAADAEWRRIGHKIADAVYERLTGDQGYFDTKVVYVSETGAATSRIKRLAIMDYDGANHRFLTDGRDLVLTPRIAPDGIRVAYLAYRDGRARVYMTDLRTERDTLLGDFPGMSFSPRFSPDGRQMLLTIARDGNSDIYRLDLGSRQMERLTTGLAIDTSPSYAPDVRDIVFNSDRGGSPQLYIMNAAGGETKRISFGEGRYGSPAWSPRGDLIAFTKIKGGFFHIGVMRPDGGDERLLTRSFLDENPTWSPNGRIVMFGREDPTTNTQRIRTIEITGRNERLISTPLDASDPDWSALLP